MISAAEALEKLQAGNRRFVAGAERQVGQASAAARRRDLVAGQSPFAILLGCSDSRVPAEIVFDLGLGDLFVVRVAGNIAAPSQIGSVEFAAQQFGTRLVVVMGHSRCGAIQATLDSMDTPSKQASSGIQSIVDRIRPSLEPLVTTEFQGDREAMVQQAVRANVQASAAQLREGSEILRGLIAKEGLRVVGAEYALETGEVDFFDGAYGV